MFLKLQKFANSLSEFSRIQNSDLTLICFSANKYFHKINNSKYL